MDDAFADIHDNEMTPLAELMWKTYTQLLRAGFDRKQAQDFTIALVQPMVTATIAKAIT